MNLPCKDGGLTISSRDDYVDIQCGKKSELKSSKKLEDLLKKLEKPCFPFCGSKNVRSKTLGSKNVRS